MTDVLALLVLLTGVLALLVIIASVLLFVWWLRP